MFTRIITLASFVYVGCQMGSEADSPSSSSVGANLSSSSKPISSVNGSSALSSSSVITSSSTQSVSSSAGSSSSVAFLSSAANEISMHCKTDTLRVKLNEVGIFDCEVVQKSGTAPEVYAQRADMDVIAKGWTATFCFGPSCYAPMVLKSEPLQLELNKAEILTYDVTPKSVGSAQAVVKIVDQKSGKELLSHNFWVIGE